MYVKGRSSRGRSRSPESARDRQRSRSRSRSPRREHLALINEREQARKNKDWAAADQIRDKLKTEGVTIDDKQHFWTDAKGKKFAIGDGNATSTKKSLEQRLSNDEITELINERERARHAKDFSRSDLLRERLWANGVDVRDKEKVWKHTDGRIGVIPDWGPPNSDGTLTFKPQTHLNEAAIAFFTAERDQARQKGEYERADKIRSLLTKMGVRVSEGRSDREGRSAPVEPPLSPPLAAAAGESLAAILGGMVHPALIPALAQAVANPYVMAALQAYGIQGAMQQQHHHQQQQQSTSIEALIAQREQCRYNHDYAGADALRDTLRNYGVILDDKAKKWSSEDGRSGEIPTWTEVGSKAANGAASQPSPPRFQLTSLPRGRESTIEELIQQREKCRYAHNFSGADEIRDKLKAMGVTIDDKGKTWSGQDGRSGGIPKYASFLPD